MSEGDWPNLPTTYERKTSELELVKNAQNVVHSLVLVADKDRDTIDLEAIIDIQRFSTKLKLLHVTAWILKFISATRATRGQSLHTGIDANELKEAERRRIKSIQRHEFATEYRNLLSGKNLVYHNQFILFLDNGIVRCRGRVNQADLPVNAKNPVLLPEKHTFSRLVIEDKHELVHHNGIRETLAATRQDYWILKGRKIVKSVV